MWFKGLSEIFRLTHSPSFCGYALIYYFFSLSRFTFILCIPRLSLASHSSAGVPRRLRRLPMPPGYNYTGARKRRQLGCKQGVVAVLGGGTL